MKTDKILYSPITPVLITAVLLVIGLQYSSPAFPLHQNTVTKALNKQNPAFNEIILASCSNNTNPYKDAQIQWNAQISNYAHTGGIRFSVVDDAHPETPKEEHGHFWGTFLGSADDPRFGADGDYSTEGLRKWGEDWNNRWVEYILDVYGGIDDNDRDSDTIFKVTATIDNVDCDPYYDGGYIETSVIKIEKVNTPGFSLANHFPSLKYKTIAIEEYNNHARIDIKYPQFIGGEEVKNLNKYVQDFVLGQLSQDRERIQRLIKEGNRSENCDNSVDRYQYECSVNLTFVYRVASMINDIISIEIISTDYTGGGNGNHDEVTAINWDLKSDRFLTAQDLFCKTNYPAVLSPLAYQAVINQFENPWSLNQESLDWIRNGIASSENYTDILLGYKGITIIFQSYTVLSGAAGVVKVPLPYSLVRDTLCLP